MTTSFDKKLKLVAYGPVGIGKTAILLDIKIFLEEKGIDIEFNELEDSIELECYPQK